MAAKWIQKIKDKLQCNPLYYNVRASVDVQHMVKRLEALEGTISKEHIETCVCANCGGSGKKVPLYAITNYGREFDHCFRCNYTYR
jgi:hypothetical protein